MAARIVIAGESQCNVFAEVCIVADYLAQNLPDLCYERIEKPVVEWEVCIEFRFFTALPNVQLKKC